MIIIGVIIIDMIIIAGIITILTGIIADMIRITGIKTEEEITGTIGIIISITGNSGTNNNI